MSAENALKKRTMKRIMVKRDVPTVTAAQAKVAETGADLRNAEVNKPVTDKSFFTRLTNDNTFTR